MSDAMQEKISALVDGEVHAAEIQPALEALKSDPELLLCWQRYHLLSDALKNNLPPSPNHDLFSRVSQAIEAESPHQAPLTRHRSARAFAKPALGFALAASVATVAYLGLGQQQPGGAGMGAQQVAAIPPPSNVYRQVRGTHWDVGQPAVQSKLNHYLASHSEYSNVDGVRPGMMPYVRIVDYTQDER